MKRLTILIPLAGILLICMALLLAAPEKPDNFSTVDRYAQIDPDYVGVTIPPNIAPLNFVIKEAGERFRVVVSAPKGQSIVRENSSGLIQFPLSAWRKLLAENRGGELSIEVLVRDQTGEWRKFQTIKNLIANEEIDSHLVYRLLNSAYTLWSEMGIYQRNLENFDEKPVIENRATEGKCMNCHSFNQNNPNTMMMHLRGGEAGGTLIVKNGQVRKVDTATEFNRAGAYPAWHPNGRVIAFSVNTLEMFFHSKACDPRDVLDRGSNLILYDTDTNVVTTVPQIAAQEWMESFPAWSPDGSYLYFCRCPEFQTFLENDELCYEKILYDLVRISYNAETGEWGQVEPVLCGKDLGKSITLPRVSPDGQYVAFVMASDGHFPVYKSSSDVYVLNLLSRELRKPDINCEVGDTYPSWSSNGRWLAFSSKRMDAVNNRPHFSYWDQNGRAHKPFVLPQKDPAFYHAFLKTYNRPELITGPVTISPHELVATAYDNEHRLKAELDPQVVHQAQPAAGEKIVNIAPN